MEILEKTKQKDRISEKKPLLMLGLSNQVFAPYEVYLTYVSVLTEQ